MRARQFLALVAVVLFATACRPRPPFPADDPPPTWAFKLLAQDDRLYSRYSGSGIRMGWVRDSIHPTFVSFGENRLWDDFATFSSWNIVNDGRWPGTWEYVVTRGCGEGRRGAFNIDHKLEEFYCVPTVIPVNVNPSSAPTSAFPGTLALQFAAGAGAPVDIYVLDPNASTVITGPVSTTINGAGQAWISVPTSLGAGQYYVLAESSVAPEAGGAGDFTVYTPSPPPTGSDTMQPAQRLYAGQYIGSQNGSHGLTYQTDGNLVLYGPSGAVWATMVGSSPGWTEMQTDGNLVSYDGAAVPVWATMTFQAGSVLRVENQGQIVMYGPNGNAIWWAP